jgi:hypothetical protein
MYVIQNFKQKSIARKITILLAAITLSTAVATNALAAGHGGGGGGGGSLGGGGAHIGGGFGDGHVGGGLGGGGFAGGRVGGGAGGVGFAGGHIGVGSAGGRMIGDHLGGYGEAFLGNRGANDFHSPRMGGDLYDRAHDRDRDHDHDRDHHFRQRFVGFPGYYYDDYGYGVDDYAGDPPPAPAVRAPEAEPACHRTFETFNVPATGGGTREITVIGCP